MDQPNIPTKVSTVVPADTTTVASAISTITANQNTPKLTFTQKLTGFFGYLFTDGRIWLFLIAAGLLLAKFGGTLIDLLSLGSKKDIEKAQKQDAVLKGEEDQANAQADALIKESNNLPSQEGQVNQDWNKKS